MKVIWKDVPNYDGDYQVSNFGRVKSFKLDKTKGKIMALCHDSGGYPQVGLSKDKSHKKFNIHKLMQMSFKLGDGFVDHIDGCKTNNVLSNLRIVTHRENMQNMKCHRKGNLVGVYFDKGLSSVKNPWVARISINKVRIYLGNFKTEEEAHKAYKKEFNKLVRKC
jgi:hypothetical protein